MKWVGIKFENLLFYSRINFFQVYYQNNFIIDIIIAQHTNIAITLKLFQRDLQENYKKEDYIRRWG